MARHQTDGKVCHFAHYRTTDGVKCGRRNATDTSADHLLITGVLNEALLAQGLKVEFRFPEPLGSAVRALLPDGRIVHVHVSKDLAVPWHDPELCQIILGPGVRVDPDILAERGQVLRARVRDRRGRGTVDFGTEYPGTGTYWFPTDQLRVTENGLADTTAPQPRDAARQPAPPPIAKPSSQTDGPGATTPGRSATEQPARQLPAHRTSDEAARAVSRLHSARAGTSTGAVMKAERAIEDLLAQPDTTEGDSLVLRPAARSAAQWLDEWRRSFTAKTNELQRQYETTNPDPQLLEDLYNLAREPAAPADHREVVLQIRQAVKEAHKNREETAERRRNQENEAQSDTREALLKRAREVGEARERALRANEEERRRLQHVEDVKPLEDVTRGALRKAAREQRTVTWAGLASSTGWRQLNTLSPARQLELLALVDRSTPSGEPLLACSLTEDGSNPPLELYRRLAERMGRAVPESDAELHTHIRTELAALHNR